MIYNKSVGIAFVTLCCWVALLTCLVACANQGSGPDGGPYDETPPRVLHLSPALGAIDSKAKKVTITFDELVKLENASEKVVVSPPQIEMPEIKTVGRKITVELLDTLRENTTYTIDFSDAIVDNNEGNPMGQFTYYFSTGKNLDTMEVSGHVLMANDLEPVKGILVGLHSDTTDTAFTSKPFDRVAHTDGNGHFSIKGVAPGNYRIYALKDMDGDFKHSRGERLAFIPRTITPGSYPDVRHDTVWIDTVRYDTILAVPYTHYTPDDVVLLAFDEKRTERQLLKTQRDEPEWFRVIFTAPSEDIPTIEGLNFDATDAFLEERSVGNDTITYWLRNLAHFPSIDTLQMAYTYLCYDDSTATNVMRTDTLELIPKNTMARRLKKQAEDLKKWEKALEKRHKRGDFSQETPPVEHLYVEGLNRSRLAPNENLHLRLKEPAVRLDTVAFRLYQIKDSLRIEEPLLLLPHPRKLQEFTIMGEWRPGCRYELEVDSAAIEGISGKVNAPVLEKINIPELDSYGALFLILPDADSTTVVQLMKGKDKVERWQRAVDGRVDFFYLTPAVYYLRAFTDRNANGEWDTGCYADSVQPEPVYYFPVAIEARANWDIEQTWRFHELPLTRQKPQELVKQREDKKKKARSRNEERERERGRR